MLLAKNGEILTSNTIYIRNMKSQSLTRHILKKIKDRSLPILNDLFISYCGIKIRHNDVVQETTTIDGWVCNKCKTYSKSIK